MDSAKDSPNATAPKEVDWGEFIMEKAYQEYVEDWRSGYGSGSDACGYIAEAFALCPDLIAVRAYRDVDNDQVDISPVWSTAPEIRSSDSDRANAIKKLSNAESNLTECHEFTLYAQTPRPEGNPLNHQASIAIGLKLPQAQAYLEAKDLRAHIALQTQPNPAADAPKHRL